MRDMTLIRLAKRARHSTLLAIAWVWRRLMFRTTFIAVTGSVGKSTCREVTAAVLGSKYPTISTIGNANFFGGVTRTVRRVRPWHKYAVIEVGIVEPGQMARFARALRPDIVILVSIAKTHTMNFRTLETTLREKTALIEGMKPGGVAILNDDNPYIAGYQPPSSIRTVYYGSTPRSQFRATDASSRWPERLSFTLHGPGGEARRVHTRMLGEHWLGSLIPAFAVAAERGLSLAQASEAMGKQEPIARRLSPVELPNGATILRDEINGSVDTMAAALRVFADASAPRKMLVFTDVSDSSKKPRTRLRDYGREAARVADSAIFLGENCEHGANAAVAAGMRPDQVWSFYNIRDCAQHLKNELRAGDLVLLRGRRVDHLDRVYYSLVQDVTCWKNRCGKAIQCHVCPELNAKRPVGVGDGALMQLRR